MNKIVLCFGPYENITPSGMDGIRIQFNFSKINSRFLASPAEHQAKTLHRLIVDVAATIDWADDEVALAKILFEMRAQEIIESMSREGNLPNEILVSVPRGDLPLDPGRLDDIEGTVIEVELPSMHTRRLERK